MFSILYSHIYMQCYDYFCWYILFENTYDCRLLFLWEKELKDKALTFQILTKAVFLTSRRGIIVGLLTDRNPSSQHVRAWCGNTGVFHFGLGWWTCGFALVGPKTRHMEDWRSLVAAAQLRPSEDCQIRLRPLVWGWKTGTVFSLTLIQALI